MTAVTLAQQLAASVGRVANIAQPPTCRFCRTTFPEWTEPDQDGRTSGWWLVMDHLRTAHRGDDR